MLAKLPCLVEVAQHRLERGSKGVSPGLDPPVAGRPVDRLGPTNRLLCRSGPPEETAVDPFEAVQLEASVTRTAGVPAARSNAPAASPPSPGRGRGGRACVMPAPARLVAELLERLDRGAETYLSCGKRRLRIRRDQDAHLVRDDGRLRVRDLRRALPLHLPPRGQPRLGSAHRPPEAHGQDAGAAKACFLVRFEQGRRTLEQPDSGGHVLCAQERSSTRLAASRPLCPAPVRDRRTLPVAAAVPVRAGVVPSIPRPARPASSRARRASPRSARGARPASPFGKAL